MPKRQYTLSEYESDYLEPPDEPEEDEEEYDDDGLDEEYDESDYDDGPYDVRNLGDY